jgi:tetratricopeptide (TPR) repeat protein
MEYGEDLGSELPDTGGSVNSFRETLVTFLDLDEAAPIFETKADLIEGKLGEAFGFGSEDYMQRNAFVEHLRGAFAFNSGDADSAISYFDSAYDVFSTLAEQSTDTEEIVVNRHFAFRSSMNLGNIYFICGDKNMAMHSYTKAMGHAESILNPNMPGTVRQDIYPALDGMVTAIASDMREGVSRKHEIAHTYAFAKKHELQIPYTPNGISKARELTMSPETIEFLGGVESDRDDITLASITDELETYINEVEETDLTGEVPDPTTVKAIELGNMSLALGLLYVAADDLKGGMELFDQAAERYMEAEYTSLVADAMALKAKTLFRHNLIAEAASAADEAIEYFYCYFAEGLASEESTANLQRLMDEAYVPIKNITDEAGDITEIKARFKKVGIKLINDEDARPVAIGNMTVANLIEYDVSKHYEDDNWIFNPN